MKNISWTGSTYRFFEVPSTAAPNFDDDTGDPVVWEINQPIAKISVPAATGTPIPTYAVQGRLPAGITFNTRTREIEGTPTAKGSGTITIRATNSEGSDDWSVNFKTITPVALSDLPTAGLFVDCAAILRRSTAAGANLYADSNRGGTDSPLDGDLAIGPNDNLISRIYWQNPQFRFNDNDKPSAFDMGDYFGTGGSGRGSTFHIIYHDSSGDLIHAQAVVSSITIQSGGGNFVNFADLPSAFTSALNAIAQNTRWLFAITQVGAEINLKGSAEAGAGEASGRLSVQNPAQVILKGSAEAGAGEASGRLVVDDSFNLVLRGDAEAGAGEASGRLTVDNFQLLNLRGEAEAGAGEASGRLAVRNFHQVLMRGEAEAGAGEASGRLIVENPPNTLLRGSAEAGDPEASGRLEVSNVDFPEPMVATIFEFTERGEFYWQGVGDLVFRGNTYKGAAFISLKSASASVGSPQRRATASFNLPVDIDRAPFLQDPGPEVVKAEWIVSRDYGQTWMVIGVPFVGRLSSPKIRDGVFSIEVETHAGDVDRGNPSRWSDADQQEEYPGDRGFFMTAKLEEGIDLKWPP